MKQGNFFRGKWYRWALIVAGIIVFLWLSVSFYFFRVATYGYNTRGCTENLEEKISSGEVNRKRYKKLRKTVIKVRSIHGYILDGLILINSRPSKLTVIICHGIGRNKWSMLPVAELYLDLGYNVMIYDHRAHGESGGNYPSYGYYEKDDLETMVQLVAERLPRQLIAVHGESMGAATALQHAAINNNRTDIERKAVDYYISDCSYADLRSQFRYLLKRDYGLPDLLLVDGASLFNYLLHGFWFHEVSLVSMMQKITVPVLFIHGQADDYIIAENAIELVRHKREPRMLYLCPEAKHAESYIKCKEEYKGEILEFMKYWLRWQGKTGYSRVNSKSPRELLPG